MMFTPIRKLKKLVCLSPTNSVYKSATKKNVNGTIFSKVTINGNTLTINRSSLYIGH